MEFHCIHKIEELSQFEKGWDRLANDVKTPLLSYDWIVSAVKAFHKRDRLNIGILTNDHSEIVGIIPLVEKNTALVKELRPVGIDKLGEPGGVLFKNNMALEMVVEWATAKLIPLFLENIPLNQAKLLNSRSISIRKNGIHYWKPSNYSCYLKISGGWNAYWASLPSKRRNDIRRARRRAESFGKPIYTFINPFTEQLAELLERAYRIENRNWKSQNHSSLETNPRLKDFFSELAFRMQAKGYLRLGFLTIDGLDAAMLIGLEYGNSFWLLKIGYDQRFRKCSPGILLITESIRYAFQRQLRIYEFLGSYEPWLRTWVRSNDFHQYGLYAFYPFRFSGLYRFIAQATAMLYRKLPLTYHSS